MKKEKLDNILKHKMHEDLPQGFDQRFWQKFSQENPEFSQGSWKDLFSFKLLIPVVSMAMAALIVGNLYLSSNSINVNPETQVITSEELVEDLGLYYSLGENEMTDQDWEILLGENS